MNAAGLSKDVLTIVRHLVAKNLRDSPLSRLLWKQCRSAYLIDHWMEIVLSHDKGQRIEIRKRLISKTIRPVIKDNKNVAQWGILWKIHGYECMLSQGVVI